jgi:hypothetical protein
MNNLRQQLFLKWAARTFGAIALDRHERTARFVEEAIEVGHAEGLPREIITALIERAYSRPPGLIPKEIGQAAVTLEMLAEIDGISVEDQARREFTRVKALPRSHWTARHDAKIKEGIAI